MPELLQYYGISVNRSNRIPCPMHNGDDANCGVKEHYIHCFVCGQSADAIKFVQIYFGLTFGQATEKINTDFSLGLPIGQKINHRQRLEMERRSFVRQREINAEKQKRQELDEAYQTALDEWIRLDTNRSKYAPQSPTEPLHPLFVEALKNIAGAEYNLSCVEIVRYEYENRNSRHS